MTLFDEWLEYLPDLLTGLLVSLQLVGASLAGGLPLGLLLALSGTASARLVRWPTVVLVESGRAVPAVVLLQLAYYGLPSIEVVLSNMAAAILGLAWITAAYSSEIFRGGIASVPRGQYEASAALGVSAHNTYRSIIIPQAVRVALPALLGLSIQIFQATALAFTIGLPELMSSAYDLGNQNFRFLSVLTLAGLLYTAIVIPASMLVRHVELQVGKHISADLR